VQIDILSFWIASSTKITSPEDMDLIPETTAFARDFPASRGEKEMSDLQLQPIQIIYRTHPV
jgi:hypothetical protein